MMLGTPLAEKVQDRALVERGWPGYKGLGSITIFIPGASNEIVAHVGILLKRSTTKFIPSARIQDVADAGRGTAGVSDHGKEADPRFSRKFRPPGAQ